MIYVFLGVLGLVGFSSAQITQDGQCAAIIDMTDFNIEEFLDIWHELRKSSNQNPDCSTLEFTNGAQEVITVSNPSVVNNFLQTASGTAIHTTDTAILTLTLTSSATPIEFRILNTDYINYAVAYNCVNSGDSQRIVNVWLLGRETTSLNTEEILSLANETLEPLDITVAELPSIDHSPAACTQLPVIEAGQPIILTGQCSTTTPVVQNFRVEDFVGTWHEISSYHSENALGTCARADYTRAGTTVNIVNSQVLNQELDTISGTATLDDNGEGRLHVVLDVQGTQVTQELLIIDTDYTGYAVSYTCVNLENNERQVNSWILSKTRQISAASQTQVDRVIGTLVDLNTEYYQTSLQTDDACFYYPEAVPGKPVVFPGQCDDTIDAVPTFNLNQFADVWYEVEAYPKEGQTGTCVNHQFTTVTDSLNFVSSQVVNERLNSANGNVVLESTDGSGRLRLNMTVNGQDISFPYWILATDYDSFALVYSCENINADFRSVHSWKLSRTQSLSAAAVTAIDTAIAPIQVLQNEYYEPVGQTTNDCFYYPEAVPGNPVVFPGQCDDTIDAVPTFNLNQFADVWYEVEAYPKEDQTGTCVNHQFTTVTDSLNFVSSQVVNERLNSANGNVVLESTDGSGRLSLNMTVNGQDISFPYWILATDYDSFALVYSCENINADFRSVHSWKLSRTQSLSAAAVTAIDTAIAPIQVLQNEYYEPVGQTTNDCFYYPEAVPGKPVVFPGQCDDTIDAVPTFNLNQFADVWYEVEAYPKEDQTGTCVNHQFTTVTDSLNLVSNQVVNERLTSANGNVVLESTDGSGRLRLNMTVNGQDISFPYWILATDYDSFALVYSCENINADFRSVHSWKLSRTQSLSAAAVTAIDTAIAPIQVLQNEYYEPVGQTTNDCFYYPEAVPGNPVVFPGQCDDTIDAVPTFNLNQFADVWYEVEAYPKEDQTGTCVNHQFTTVTDSLNFVSNQVVNERLTSANGNVVLESTDGSGRLRLNMTVNGQDISFPYWILATDYDSFALVYSCENINADFRSVHSWKLSRTQSLSAAAVTAIDTAIAPIQVLQNEYYEPVGQTTNDCFYYPFFDETPESIILPGSCPTISGKANFSPADYVGNWFDVDSYPTPSRNGTCARAEYAGPVDGVITIKNTIVVDGRLQTQSGIARLSSGGTGLLTVTIYLENGEVDVSTYYILETDYTSFSLVYNCRNLGDGRRQVFSWKLSRTPTLTTNANVIIDKVVRSTQGLLEDYYESTSQTAENCFYIPESVSGQSVLFRGACEPVTAITGFNVPQYLGWWHEIERYPTDVIPGECISADFRQNGNVFQVTETSVYGGVANETASIAVLNVNGTITISGSEGPTVWHVLDTDYNNYALLYSCETVSTTWGDYRRVWSAKHSKARSLTTAAQTAMNLIIAANELLYQDLYEEVNQNATACFHYREEAGEQVILPGKCDPEITVQSDFDATRFPGTWYQLERYPYPQVSNSATCIGSRYTENGNSLTVLNWEALSGTLNTIEGTATINATTATLSVTLPVQGSEATTTTQFRVLLTDYDDFALVYTCTNVNDFQRAVGAFKLSRNRQLSNAARQDIGSYVAQREELHEPYFISIAHNEECPEPSSALLVKSSIIIMVACILLQLVK